MTNIKDVATALRLFEEAAAKHAEATEQGDYRRANKCYATIAKAVEFLKKEDEIQKLSEFLNYSSVGVRMWAAAYILPVMEGEGVRVLKQIAEDTGIHSLTAGTTLSEWQKGNLKL